MWRSSRKKKVEPQGEKAAVMDQREAA